MCVIESVRGSLRVGVPEALMMKSLNETRYSSFSLPSQGYCWTDLELSGSLDQPNDNFLRTLQASPASGSSSGSLLHDPKSVPE